MLLDVNKLHGSVAWKPKNAHTETRRQTEWRILEFFRDIVARRLWIPTDRKIYDQYKMTLRLAISWEPRAKQIPSDLWTSVPLASRWIIPGSIHCHSVINNFNFRVQYLIYTLINFYSSAAMNETTQPVCLFKLFRLGFLLLYYSCHPRKNKFKIW